MGGVDLSKTQESEIRKVSFAEAARFWIKLGFISFGGPAGQIAIMQTECVDKRRWIGQRAFLSALNFCMLLPGPEATQLAAYIGWRMHGLRGAVFAGVAFVVPGVFLLVLLSWLAAAHGETTLIKAAFDGIKPTVVAIVVMALWRIGRRASNTVAGVAMAAAAFTALYFFDVPFPAVIATAAAVGMASTRVPGLHFSSIGHGEVSLPDHAVAAHGRPLRRLVLIGAVFLALWAAPVAAVIAVFGTKPFADVAQLFTVAAFVTFGGAYAVLPYIADAGVNTYQWLTAADMVNGLALAETTPGPLILVTTYVGYFAGWNGAAAAALAPWLAALIAALLTTYVTFLPSFLFIIAGAPYIEWLQTLAWARGALAAITAAVVGVVLNLTVFFGRAVLFPAAGGLDAAAAVAALVAFALLLTGRISVPWLVALGAAYGLVKALVFP